MHTPSKHLSRRSSRRQKREGAALLIVLFILMMSTVTAVYAMQSTQLEQRAAGALQQAMRTKYVAEAATNAVLAMCLELGSTGCVDLKHGTLTTNDQSRYGLPTIGTTELNRTTITSLDFSGPSWPVNANDTGSSVLPDDSSISGSAATAYPYKPDFMTTVEKWQVPAPGESRPRYRLIVSTYGILNLGRATGVDPGGLSVESDTATDIRGAHESVSATRAFFDVR